MKAAHGGWQSRKTEGGQDFDRTMKLPQQSWTAKEKNCTSILFQPLFFPQVSINPLPSPPCLQVFCCISCVCMQVCVLCVQAHGHVCLCACVYTCVGVCCMHWYVCVQVCACVCVLCTCMWACGYMCAHVCACICVCVHVCECACMCVRVYVCVLLRIEPGPHVC
jgi:hypothetical protein